jgi:hypothetical protein
MPVLLITKFHYIVPKKEIEKIAYELAQEDIEEPDRKFHWKIYGINEEKCNITTIYLYDAMEEAVKRKEYVEALADLLNTYADKKEFEIYDVMVDQSLRCEAPILMADIGLNGIEQIFSENPSQRVIE